MSEDPSTRVVARGPMPADVVSLDPDLTYSVCTLVTEWDLYRELMESFRLGGFDEPDTEFLYVDNRGTNRFDAFAGLNLLLARARGASVILVHQDVRLLDAGATELDRIIQEMNTDHPDWGVLSNAGGVAPGQLAIRISDPHGDDQRVGDLPARVHSVDENLIVVRADANLGFSADLSGFHLYGADLCLLAEQRGFGAYVVDFHVRHLSGGKKDAGFARVESELVKKHQRAAKGRWIQTPSTRFYVSASAIRNRIANTRLVRRLARIGSRR